MKLPANQLKCKFCNFTVPTWFTKGGNKHSGWKMLQSHIMLEHEEEYKKIQIALDDEESINGDR